VSARVQVSGVRFTPATDAESRRGLLGWVTCTLNGLVRLRGITLRRTAQGRLAISFPCSCDSVGRRLPYIKPIARHVRREIERQILEALDLQEPAV
jgi:hypothetical protein